MSAPASAAAPVDVAELRRQANEQGEVVKALKKELKDNSAAKDDPRLKEALAKLMAIKAALDTAILGDPAEIARLQAAKKAKEAEMAWRQTLEAVIAQRGFFFRSNEIHPNAPSGFYDFGPNGCAVKQNLLQLWRNWFVLHESMLEIECPTMTPESVFITSGHVARFTDFMVTCEKEDMSYRADKLLEEWCEKRLADDKAPLKPEERAEIEKVERDAGAMNAEQLKTWFTKFALKSPEGNPLSDPFPFNLMFKSQIGPSGKVVGYLRPETAQGMFVNFKRLLEINSGKMPFAAAQIGTANRNEIAPRQGLLRVREFTLAEIEHFVHPDDKRHANFADIASLPLLLLPRAAQEKGEMAAQKIQASVAVSEKIINNETLAYFMARTQLFLIACGIKEEKLRFRQHKATEMAHYASDCWDAEILTSYGWIECVGHADRAAYDLEVHSKATGADLTAQETFDKPRSVEVAKFDIKNALVGKTFGKRSKEVTETVRAMDTKAALELEATLASKGSASLNLPSGGDPVVLTREMVSVSVKSELQHTAKYTPHVIEPAFGIGRIFYAMLEHTFYTRPAPAAAAAPAVAASSASSKAADAAAAAAAAEKRAVFALPAFLSPHKLSILPLSSNPDFLPFQTALKKDCIQLSLTNKVDDSSGSIGKRYSRADEIGIPFGCTIDFQTKEDNTVTIRERDSMQQIRVAIKEAVPIVARLCQGQLTWKDAYEQYPKFNAPQE